MGYTHYWYRPLEIPPDIMKKIAQDIRKLVPVLEQHGVKLADGLGRGKAEITAERIWFNGPGNCGHEQRDLCIAWPAPGAGGVGETKDSVEGSWFAGSTISTRCCGGDCSHETFSLPQKMGKEYLQESSDHPGLYFECCKTAFKPYDIAVTAALIVAKHYLGDQISVSSDGEEAQWFDGQMLCQTVLDYGMGYTLEKLGAVAEAA